MASFHYIFFCQLPLHFFHPVSTTKLKRFNYTIETVFTTIIETTFITQLKSFYYKIERASTTQLNELPLHNWNNFHYIIETASTTIERCCYYKIKITSYTYFQFKRGYYNKIERVSTTKLKQVPLHNWKYFHYKVETVSTIQVKELPLHIHNSKLFPLHIPNWKQLQRQNWKSFHHKNERVSTTKLKEFPPQNWNSFHCTIEIAFTTYSQYKKLPLHNWKSFHYTFLIQRGCHYKIERALISHF